MGRTGSFGSDIVVKSRTCLLDSARDVVVERVDQVVGAGTEGAPSDVDDREAEIVELLGPDGEPPFRVRFEDGHEAVMSPGPDSVVQARKKSKRPA